MSRKKKGLAGRWHVHGCVDCDQRYEDSCARPEVNGRCETCAHGHQRGYDRGQYDPWPCCPSGATRMTDQDLQLSLRLAGPGPWFRCATCSRTFAVHPNDQKTITCECGRTVPHIHKRRGD